MCNVRNVKVQTLLTNNIVVIFYVTSATVLFCSISLTEISQVEKLYMSVGTNMLMNGKLDNSCLSVIDLGFKTESVCNIHNGGIAHFTHIF